MFPIPLRDTQPSYSRPLVTSLIIAVNVAVFLHQITLDGYSQNYFMMHYGLVPRHPHASALVTSMFLHGGWLHIIGNMWFLWIFGDNVEDVLGHGKYLIFYLLCGVAAAVTQVFFSGDSRVPMVGASGAIAGVMGAYMVKFPQSRIVTLIFFIFITFIDVPAWLMLIYWFAVQFFSGIGSIGYSTASEGGVAFFAHVGGFLTGIVLINLLGTKQRYSQRSDLQW